VPSALIVVEAVSAKELNRIVKSPHVPREVVDEPAVIHPLVTFHVPTGLPPQGVTVPHAPGLAASLLEPSLPESSLPLEPPSLEASVPVPGPWPPPLSLPPSVPSLVASAPPSCWLPLLESPPLLPAASAPASLLELPELLGPASSPLASGPPSPEVAGPPLFDVLLLHAIASDTVIAIARRYRVILERIGLHLARQSVRCQ
jgi:hypothetical protein